MHQRPLHSALVWFRRDLRATDHAALYHALRHARQVWCVFVFDTDILNPLPRVDRRVEFILESLRDLNQQLNQWGQAQGRASVGLLIRHGRCTEELPKLAQQLAVQAVYANHDDEPAALLRDEAVRRALATQGMALHTHKDHVIFERSEVLTQSQTPYTVFTPYKNAWLKKLTAFDLQAYATERYADALAEPPAGVASRWPTLQGLGFAPSNLRALNIPTGSTGAQQLWADFLPRMGRYDQTRDFPHVKGPSYLSVHLRFGTVSIRSLARQAHHTATPGPSDDERAGAMVWLSELIWRDFYHQILHHHPRVVDHSFKPEYDAIEWEQGPQAEALFLAWCEGRTGYPLVDAAMAQLNQTGYMHNRLRMVVASFLVKDLGIDWRWGERYFAEQLNDFDLAANNGGWQWAASTGCDAQPYFRIFNPVSQSEKFDAQGKFIRRNVPALGALPERWIHAPWLASASDLREAGVALGQNYPFPVVDHAEARNKTLQRFGVVKP